MSNPYEHLEELEENQRQAWLIDTEPDEGTPNKQHLVKTNDALEIAFDMLNRLMRKIIYNNRFTYTPNCRWRLNKPTDGQHPLGGRLDATDFEIIDPSEILLEIEQLSKEILPEGRRLNLISGLEEVEPLLRFWERTQFMADEDIFDQAGLAPLQQQGIPQPLPRNPKTPTQPWWEKPKAPNPRNPKVQRFPQATPRGGAIGSITILDALIDLTRAFSAIGVDSSPYDDAMAQAMQVGKREAKRQRERKNECYKRAVSDIERARNWIRQVTEPDTYENRKQKWGLKTTDTAKRTTRKFMSRK